MGLSGLNYHRHNYNFIDSAQCERCGFRKEDPLHYFLDCPSYAEARLDMLERIIPIVNHILDTFTINISNNSVREKEILTHVLLHGSQELSDVENINLFNILFAFITESKRFL